MEVKSMENPARALLPAAEFLAVSDTIATGNRGMPRFTAERILVQALAFVATAARYRGAAIAPSRVVDEGWHALILHTKSYAALCDRLGGFVHHYPQPPEPRRQPQTVIDRTTALMGEAGFVVDGELWRTPAEELVVVAADCGHTPPGGCGPIGPQPRPGPMPRSPGQSLRGADSQEVTRGVDRPAL
ncbi:glycine-rich domain-containing protein [Streptomyces chrestomyceticus]|uniref:glycine-rich domain-containing protein n=1 Tax=Streptomyces chrestomyceticus TaxID=68185 RepID=UPI0035A87104